MSLYETLPSITPWIGVLMLIVALVGWLHLQQRNDNTEERHKLRTRVLSAGAISGGSIFLLGFLPFMGEVLST